MGPATPGAGPVRLGSHAGAVTAVAVLSDGRVVSGGFDDRVLVWDPANPRAGPVKLRHHLHVVSTVAVLSDGRVVSGGHDGGESAVAGLPDGRVVSGGEDRRVLVWDIMTQTTIAQLDCSVTALAAEPIGGGETALVIGHAGAGLSLWSVTNI
jgi:WD40 repeat protein